jgi:hypothetical protein
MQRQDTDTSESSDKSTKSSLARLWERTAHVASHAVPGLQNPKSFDSVRNITLALPSF